jgi:hypothetical protein
MSRLIGPIQIMMQLTSLSIVENARIQYSVIALFL